MSVRLKQFGYAGIPKIEIPKKIEDINEETIKQYLPQVLGEFESRKKKLKYLQDQFDGFQEIYEKTRKYEGEERFNNKSVENHAIYQVNFKKGYLSALEFSYRNASKKDDLSILTNFMTDIGYRDIETDKIEDIAVLGVGITFTQPNKEINSSDYSADYDSPFNYEKVDTQQNFVVYSSLIGVGKDKRLFAVNISEEETWANGSKEVRKIYTVYTHRYQLRFTDTFEFYAFSDKYPDRLPYPTNYSDIPMVEHSWNQLRRGVIETVLSEFELINLIISNSMDNIVDNANNILVIINNDFEDVDINEMIKAGAILLSNPPGDTAKSDAKTLYLQFDHDKINTFYEKRIANSYAINGVPLPISNSSSGGDTGEARSLGGGWQSAYIIIRQEIPKLVDGNRLVLKQFFRCAKLVPNSKLNEIHPNDIKIEYVINQTDNIQVKTQSLIYMMNSRVPIKHIVPAVQIWSDEASVIKDWEEAEERYQKTLLQQSKNGNANVAEKGIALNSVDNSESINK